VIAELVHAFAEAAIDEARSVPKIMERDGDFWWRGAAGSMTRLTAGGWHLALSWETT
jgi:hypothetical protein